MPDPLELETLSREEQLRRVIDAALVRRAQGEALSDEELCQAHAHLMPELAAELRKLRVIGLAHAASLHETAAIQDSDIRETSQYIPLSLSRALNIRCPLCHEPFEITVDQPLEDLECIYCTGRFSLAGDDPLLKPKQPITRIAHFELIERLGMGGFGTVWKAEDTELGRTVALKIPRRGRLGPAEIEEFLHEAKVAAKLRHAHIVSIFETGRDGDNVYIVSDLIDGVSLATFNSRERLTHRQAAELLATVCDALHFAHQQGVVHRDLKPGNILLDADGVPHITDFGLAVRITEGMAITTEGEILGTPAYMSPEQARGETVVDRRTDVYSLGVMLFELLTDFLPFRGNVVMLTHHAIHTQPPSPRLLNASVPRDLETICLKCLQKDPNKRYHTTKELAEELRRFLRGDPILARPISAPQRLWRWCKQNPRIPILSASLLATVVIAYLVAWFWFESIYAQSDAKLTEQALSNVHFAAESIARTAGSDLERYYDDIREKARDPTLTTALHRITQDEEWRALCARLSDPSFAATREADELRHQLEMDPLRMEVQEWIEELTIGEHLPVFAWFVQVPDGLQIARNPLVSGGEKTIGRNYAWRAYFHGGPRDHDDQWRAGPNDHVQGTNLSPVFVSRFTNEWVLAITRPIEHDGQFVGVLGVMLRLGSFAQLPGNAQREVSASPAQRFTVLVDSRAPHPGQILQHPLYNDLADRPVERRELLDHCTDASFRVPNEEWLAKNDYCDPFAASSPTYDRRWLAAKLPVEADGKPTGLYVIVQESYDEIIGGGLTSLRRGLTLLSIVTLGLAAAMVVPAWVVILRMVR